MELAAKHDTEKISAFLYRHHKIRHLEIMWKPLPDWERYAKYSVVFSPGREIRMGCWYKRCGIRNPTYRCGTSNDSRQIWGRRLNTGSARNYSDSPYALRYSKLCDLHGQIACLYHCKKCRYWSSWFPRLFRTATARKQRDLVFPLCKTCTLPALPFGVNKVG